MPCAPSEISPHISSSPHIVPSPPTVPNPPTAPSPPYEKFHCVFCDFVTFSTKLSLVRHMIDDHPEKANGPCPDCCAAEYTYMEVAHGECECQ